ncbi:hypothetical protein SLEP1_g45164 [Rubroshorea leprosula]|uniref:Uncharacterized protein n=1 Tax=Rubroshorea leprosula TaxID=152421 RepID=A0AAV5LJS6_9ROSI|nr:hypothetical protein SLEP1_g45164 [Rubroshorea leprosula]
MSLFRTLFSSQTNSLLKIRNPLCKSLTFPSFFTRTLNSSAQIDPETSNERGNNKKSLSVLFQQAVGLSERTDTSGSESEGQTENSELKRKLKEFERDIRGLKAKSKDGSRVGKKKERVDDKESEQARRLSELFGPKKQDEGVKLRLKVEEPRVKKEVYLKLSPYAEIFVKHLYDQGYFNKATFLRDGNLDFGYFDSDYGRDYIYHAADKFGKDHQEIAKKKKRIAVYAYLLVSTLSNNISNAGCVESKYLVCSLIHWVATILVQEQPPEGITYLSQDDVDERVFLRWLSGSNLKEVALFGCPSLAKRSVFAAKRLRKFFKIEEQTVCRRCVLKDSCKLANKDVWGSSVVSLNLSDVMRVILLYALDKASPQLTVPDKIKDSVTYLLKEVVKLSRTTSL